MNLEKQPYSELIEKIGSLLQQGRQQAAQSVNTILVQTYWFIGQHIVEFEPQLARASRSCPHTKLRTCLNNKLQLK